MNREEFCNLMLNAKEKYNKSTKDIYLSTGIDTSCIWRIENNKSNFGLEKAIKYIHALNCCISIVNENESIEIKCYKDSVCAFEHLKSYNNVTNYKIWKSTGLSDDRLRIIDIGKSIMSIDIFLKLIDYFQYKILIVPLNKN